MPVGGEYREFIICGGQIIFQGIIVYKFYPAKTWEYLGNMMTISFSGALLLLPATLLMRYFQLPALYAIAAFMFVAAVMLFEHIRRTRILGLGWVLTVTWVLYRIAVLLLIMKLI